MKKEDHIHQVRAEFDDIKGVLDERRIRYWCAAKARAYNRIYKKGGVSIVSEATGVSRSRIYRGMREIKIGEDREKARSRKAGGGRKKNK